MAGIFQPTLQSDVAPIRPVETPSAITSIARLGETIVTGLSKAQDRAEIEARRNAPTYSEVKAKQDAQNLSDYATSLQEIEDTKGQISESAYNLAIRKLNMSFIGRGVDISGSEYTAARETVTGLDDALIGRSDDEILLQDLAKTPEGQSELALAAQDLKAKGIDPNQEDVAALVRQRRATKMAVDNMQITDELSFRQNKPVINDLINTFQRDTQNAVTALTDAGVTISASMVQNQYVNFLQLQNSIISKIPANIPEAQKQDVLGSLKRTEDFFVQLGMVQQGGEIKLLNPNELQVQDKVRTFVSILSKSDNAADIVLAMKVMDKNYQVDYATYNLLEDSLTKMGETTDITPEWITDADIVVTNDLIGTYNNLVRFEQSGGLESYNIEQKLRNGAMSLVNPEEQAKWSGLTNAQGWDATKAFASASNGFSKEAILSGQMTDGFYNSVAGLALSFESIDILEEPVSFDGVRKEVSSKLPELIKTAEAVDPAKGAAIRSLMFRSLTSQKFQYDTRIASDEATMGIKFNPTTGTYNVDTNTSNPRQLLLHEIVNKRYGGSISRLYEDNFRSIQWSDFPEDQTRTLTQSGMTPWNLAQSTFSNLLPSQEDFKTLLDLRNSSVYLSNLAMQIEPQAAKDAREELAQQTTQEQSSGVQSTTAALITRFESGKGGYDTLFNQAQGIGGPFEGFKVSEKTLGELYEFSNPSGAQGTYGAYVKATNPKEVLATPMGRYQFVGSTLKSVARRMGLSDDTVFNKETQDSMFLFLARDAIKGKSQEGKRKALRDTWDGFKQASNADLDKMIIEVESGNPDLGDVGGSTSEYTPVITTSELPPATTTQDTTTTTPISVVSDQNVAPTENVQATAELSPEVTQQENKQQTERPVARGPATPPEIKALLEAIGSRALTSDELTQLNEWIAGLGGGQ